MAQLTISLALCFTLPCLLGNKAQAQRAVHTEQQFIHEETIKDFARMLGVSPDNAEIHAIFSEINQELVQEPFGVKREPRPRASRRSVEGSDRVALSTTLPRVEVTEHYRFPAGKKIEPPQPMVVPEHWKAGSRGASEHFQNALRYSVKQVSERPPLPDCTRDSVVKAKLDSGNPEFDRSRNEQFLYIRKSGADSLPSFVRASMAVVECGTERGDHCAVAQEFTKVSCVPTRIVMKNGKVQRIEGKKALAIKVPKSTDRKSREVAR
jgi:hypothetical protein